MSSGLFHNPSITFDTTEYQVPMDTWYFNTDDSPLPLKPSIKPEYVYDTDDLNNFSDGKNIETNNMKHGDDYGDDYYTPTPHQKTSKRKPAHTYSPSPAAKQSKLTTFYSPTKLKPQTKGKGKASTAKASNTKTPAKPRAKAASSQSSTKFTKEEISDLFDMLTDTVESVMWKEIVETLNTRVYGLDKQKMVLNIQGNYESSAGTFEQANRATPTQTPKDSKAMRANLLPEQNRMRDQFREPKAQDIINLETKRPMQSLSDKRSNIKYPNSIE
ncbi:hypothetical protein EX30DRAFT_346389 [Ascodesmis nigricans]|uniref:Uncharacterized protein n=1 Tax=Ascodesmis nigricans TaxID=341454 RepID=A0A4S2N3G9_9PEZI|nr:hypothetical protein EX30DRAFT_346389 [Ascodesmis nigricans]